MGSWAPSGGDPILTWTPTSKRGFPPSFSSPTKSGAGVNLLAQDLENGEWRKRFGQLLEVDELDLGYRLVTAEL
jgi:hypothetical protein